MNYVVSFHNYESDDYAIEYASEQDAWKSINEDVEIEIQNCKDEGYIYRLIEKAEGIELYVPNSDIFHEWKIESMDEFIKRIWNELADIPFEESDTPSGLVLAEDWHIFNEGASYLFDKGTDREEIWCWFDEKYSKGVYSLLYSGGN